MKTITMHASTPAEMKHHKSTDELDLKSVLQHFISMIFILKTTIALKCSKVADFYSSYIVHALSSFYMQLIHFTNVGFYSLQPAITK